MNFTGNLIINTYSIGILIFLYIYSRKNAENVHLQYRLFVTIVLVTAVMLAIDILSRLDGNPGTMYAVVNHVSNFLMFLLNPVIPSLWVLYVHHQVYHDEERTKRLGITLVFINLANLTVLILSQFFGWFYTIDADNIYHRGPLFYIPASITVAMIVATFVFVVIKRKDIEKRYFFSMVFFPVLPFACVLLQIQFYGVSLMLNSVTLSLLILFFSMQHRSMNTDYLTGVYNRKKLEMVMKEKIGASTETKTFSAIMIDLDNFKDINDSYGHDAGDYALEASVKLIKSCLRTVDFVARYGGDEFYIVLDISNRNDLEATVSRIKKSIERYNAHDAESYQLGFSMGYAVYDCNSHMKVDEFQKQIDTLMYEDKQAKRELANLSRAAI
ncbi:MAG TPA: diguanylate cyclase [Clostridia bacterium]